MPKVNSPTFLPGDLIAFKPYHPHGQFSPHYRGVVLKQKRGVVYVRKVGGTRRPCWDDLALLPAKNLKLIQAHAKT